MKGWYLLPKGKTDKKHSIRVSNHYAIWRKALTKAEQDAQPNDMVALEV